MTTMLGLLFFLTSCLVSIDGHGYLLDPAARSSAWLVDQSFKQCCTYSDHMAMYCGGLQYQWHTNGGKCGICGEPYDRANKLFEKGGSMYLGKVVKTYTQGEQIDVTVVLTANHLGYFEFRLCNLDSNPDSEATQECLDRRLLTIVGTDSTKFRDVGKYGSAPISVRVQLPSDVACQHCVFQWKYTTGNNWGTDPVTGQSGVGMGVENETFMGCSDISIDGDGSPVITMPPVIVSTDPPTKKTNSATSPRTNQATNPRTSPRTNPRTNPTANPKTNPKTNPTAAPPVTTTNSRPSGGLTTWSSNGVIYKTGDIVLYDGTKYVCVNGHTSFPNAEPSALTWAWWQRVE